MSPTLIEDDLRAAFRAAADDVHPRATPLTAPEHRTSSPAARRWLVPAIAAAAVAAITVPVLAVTMLHARSGVDSATALPVSVSAGRATVAGVSFPMPSGWSAKAVAHTETAVTVCVAPRPTLRCDGVTLRIAIPDSAGAITPVVDPLTADESFDRPAREPSGMSGAPASGANHTAITVTTSAAADRPAPSSGAPISEHVPTGAPAGNTSGPATAGSTEGVPGTAAPLATTPDFATATCPIIVDQDPLDGRPAVHYSIGFCAPGSPQSADWYILDGSLAISTPRGLANEQAQHIARGLDLSGYRHAFGPQIAYFSGPGEASTHPAPAPTR